ncbi:F-box/LRR-repeat protein 4-like [Temnothorax nylanderi]|uniref:F-box/LRR-repeat protein 4-like n=1 Tax=Temnothorax nylanderi TaxID=102681 RepID=UPI003A87149F
MEMIHDKNDILKCYPSHCTEYPYLGRFVARKDADITFRYQFVKKSCGLDNCADNNPNIYKYADYISGIPKNFPNYGADFPQTFVMKNYGVDISISSWQEEAEVDYTPRDNRNKKISNYIDIAFDTCAYPIRISIYEIYNPGNVIKIWAQKPNGQWDLLWKGSPQIVPQTSRLFSPPLQACNFKTRTFRLEFKNTIVNYDTAIDAVMFIGTSKKIYSKNFGESLTSLLKRINCTGLHQEDAYNLTADYKNAHSDICTLRKNVSEYCIIYERNIEEVSRKWYGRKCYHDYKRTKVSWKRIPDYVFGILSPEYHNQKLLNNLSSSKHMKLSSDESRKLSHYSLSIFPDEIILKILKNLDLMTLYSMSCVNKRLNNIAQDSELYIRLNVRNTRDMPIAYINNIFYYFMPRCKYLQRLDLTHSDFSVSLFEEFLENCGKHLTHLRLGQCRSVNDHVLLKISTICKKLKELDLRGCRDITEEGFSYLENLEGRLEHLSLGVTCITYQTLCKILQKNQGMRELNLERFEGDLIFPFEISEEAEIYFERVTLELRNSCRDLEKINLAGVFNITPQSIKILGGCKNLRKVNLRIPYSILENNYWRLFSSCRESLEEVHLSRIRFTDYGLGLLAQCKNLKQLYLYRCKITRNAFLTYSSIFEQCLELQKFHLVYCGIRPYLTKQWEKQYPHVSILVTETPRTVPRLN